MFKYIIPVGFIGSGSSACTDLLGEYKGITAPHGSFEYVFLHCPHGLFDLADQLTVGNTALRSDAALHAFKQTMQALNRGRWWVGHYADLIGSEFAAAVDELLAELIEVRPHFYWYEQEKFSTRDLPYLAWRKTVKLLSGGRKVLPLPLNYPEMWLAWPKHAEFTAVAQKFINRIAAAIAAKVPDATGIIMDQLLLPHNLWRFADYFNDDYAAIVIGRDPRDVFIANKYVWAKNNEPVPYPTVVEEFCRMYRRLRESVQPCSNARIFTYAFEDLIYNYEATVAQIERDLGLLSRQHIAPKTKFNPAISVNNTQLWRQNPVWQEEASIIARELSAYCYNFPYSFDADLSRTF